MLANNFDSFLIDLDGVIHVGDDPVPGAPETINELRNRGKNVCFVTNNSRLRRHSIAEKLSKFGIEVNPTDIYSSGTSMVEYADSKGFETGFLIGSEELASQFVERGIYLAGDDADAVFVGHSDTYTYDDIYRATQLIYHDSAKFIAANCDGAFPTPDGIAPATGAVVRALETATGVEPTIVGKPYEYMFSLALEKYGRESTVMVGDSYSSDIKGAEMNGISSILINSETTKSTNANVEPDYIIEDITDLVGRTKDT